MDRVVVRKRIDKRILIAGGAAARAAARSCRSGCSRRASDSQSVAEDRLAIAAVESGVFEDFLPLRARVTPLVTVYLDAVEGGPGRAEAGRGRRAGRRRASCWPSCPTPICSCRRSRRRPRSSSSSTTCAARNWRWRRPAAPTCATSTRRKPNSPRRAGSTSCYRPLAEKGFVSSKVFNDTRDDLDLPGQAARDPEAQHRAGRSSCSRASWRSCGLPRRRSTAAWASPASSLGQLNIRAPVIGPAQRLRHPARPVAPAGRADRPDRQRRRQTSSRPTSTNSISAASHVGQTRDRRHRRQDLRLKVAKVYPQVRNGQFQIDLVFDGPEPASIQRGQTVAGQADAGRFVKRACSIPNGAFFNDTGGNWVFVVDKSGNGATRRAGPARPPQQRFHRGARAGSSPASG